MKIKTGNIRASLHSTIRTILAEVAEQTSASIITLEIDGQEPMPCPLVELLEEQEYTKKGNVRVTYRLGKKPRKAINQGVKKNLGSHDALELKTAVRKILICATLQARKEK